MSYVVRKYDESLSVRIIGKIAIKVPREITGKMLGADFLKERV